MYLLAHKQQLFQPCTVFLNQEKQSPIDATDRVAECFQIEAQNNLYFLVVAMYAQGNQGNSRGHSGVLKLFGLEGTFRDCVVPALPA